VILNEPNVQLRDRIEKALSNAGIEYRRGSSGGGNQMRQPYLRNIVEVDDWKNYPEVEHVHFFGWYIGNYPDLEDQEILQLCQILNEA
jgi:CDP-6-deoxy-D-xylo-4-hexulose-3-dehydrase